MMIKVVAQRVGSALEALDVSMSFGKKSKAATYIMKDAGTIALSPEEWETFKLILSRGSMQKAQVIIEEE